MTDLAGRAPARPRSSDSRDPAAGAQASPDRRLALASAAGAVAVTAPAEAAIGPDVRLSELTNGDTTTVTWAGLHPSSYTLAGGLRPSPSAFLVLVSSLLTGRTGYALGLAVTLALIGALTVAGTSILVRALQYARLPREGDL